MIIITGTPKSGKTTLSCTYEIAGKSVLHTDDLIDEDWNRQSEIVAQAISGAKYDVVEGVTAVRGLRKWLELNNGKPCDLVIWADKPKMELTKGQERMAKACTTIWNQIDGDLRSRGVRIQQR